MEKEVVTIKAYKQDRNWLETIKRKLDAKTISDALRSVRKTCVKHLSKEDFIK